jgi:glycosyltransferase involved in cell wall biosynthesis
MTANSLADATKKPRVIYWNTVPSPYMVERFDALAASNQLNFTAWFDAESHQDWNWDVLPSSWQFDALYLPRDGRSRATDVVRRLRSNRPDVLVTLYGSPTCAAGIVAAKMLGIKVILRALKTFETWRPRGIVRETAKHAIFRAVDGFHVPGPDAKEYVVSRGARPERVICFPEPVAVEHYASGAAVARKKAKARRAELGLPGCVFLYVGRLWQGKGLDYLIEAYRRTLASGIEASLVLAGDGQDEDRYRSMTTGLPNVHFTGFVQKPELPAWYGMADVLVFPTLGDPYGHVVQEAMAASLPVIATDHAGDISGRIVEGETGFIVPAADAAFLHERMQALAGDSGLRSRMGTQGYEVMRHRTIEWWAQEFENMIFGFCGRCRMEARVAA